jgi:hypothetical protein
MENKDLGGADPAFGLRPEPVALSRPDGFNRGERVRVYFEAAAFGIAVSGACYAAVFATRYILGVI